MQSRELHFKEVVSDYKDKIYRLTWSFVRNEADCEDLIQSILIKIWKNFDSFRNHSSMGTWIYKISLNTIIDFTRKNKLPHNVSNDNNIENLNVMDEGGDVEHKFIQNERLAILNACINRLSLIERTLITLYLEDMKYSEIADIMGISEKNVSVRLVRIKQKMNSMLQ
jgi:RNA polymerase sigma-70 factor (ECF subfamily)